MTQPLLVTGAVIPEKWVHTPQLCCGFRSPFLGVKIPFIVTECPAALLRWGFFTSWATIFNSIVWFFLILMKIKPQQPLDRSQRAAEEKRWFEVFILL